VDKTTVSLRSGLRRTAAGLFAAGLMLVGVLTHHV
jgi:hypothetical protein